MVSITRVAGISRIAPSPCSTRMAISNGPSGAAPHSSEATPKMAVPARNIRTAPYRATAAAPVSTRLASTIT